MDIDNGVPNTLWIVFVKRPNKKKVSKIKKCVEVFDSYQEAYQSISEELKIPNTGNVYYIEKFIKQD